MTSSVPVVRLAEVQAAAQQASDFVLSQIDAQGRFGVAQDLIFAYFKAPLCLIYSGAHAQAGLALAWMRKRFLRDGDYCGAPGDDSAPRLHMYRNAWIVPALQAVGQYAAAQQTAQLLVENLHPEFGGLLDRPEGRNGRSVFDLGGSCAAAHALLACGWTAEAERVGHFVRQRLESVDNGRLTLRVDRDGRDVGIVDAADGFYGEIRLGEPGQAYWYLGFSMRACMSLYDATGNRVWLDTALRALDLLERCGDDVFTSITNSKVAWGSANVFLATGDERARTVVLRALRWMVDTQVKEGTWIRKPSVDFAQQPLASSLEIAMERSVTLREIAMAMNLAGHRWGSPLG